jgi:hypothetical protein
VAAICGRDAASTGVSPFFLSHSWQQDLFEDFTDKLLEGDTRDSPITRVDRILQKLKEAREWAQLAMAVAQETQEQATNRKRIQALVYKKGDKVWLSLENIKTDRPKKKLDAKYAKYTVEEVMGSHTYRLNTPPGIHNVFYTKLLKLVKNSPLPGQEVDESQPPAILVDSEEQYEVERILGQKKARGRGNRQKLLVKWKGYQRPT